jgi:hypothetical protein
MSKKGSKPMRIDTSWKRRIARGIPQRQGRIPDPNIPTPEDPESVARGGVPVLSSEEWQAWRPWRRS